MKYLKILVVAAFAATALMAVASSASATTLTVTKEGANTTLPKGAELTASLVAGEKAILKSSFIGEVICEESSVIGSTENEGSATETVKGALSTLTFTKCNGTVTVLKKGSLEVHTEKEAANGNGTLTSTGTEVTVELSGLHCIFTTNNTDVGEVSGAHGETHTILTAESAAIPRTGGRSGAFCGSSATWRAKYTVTHVIYNGITYTNLTVD